jgi:spermidine dehydrogenase
MSDRDDRKLGMDRNITRRDFLNGVAVGSGGMVASSVLPDSAWEALAPSGSGPARILSTR